MPREIIPVLSGTVLEEETGLTMGQLGRICGLQAESIMAMVEEGILEPEGDGPASWRFTGRSVTCVHTVVRLERDLGINLPGAAVVLDLLERLNRLRSKIRALQSELHVDT
jgi:chaperone modulatory protein CbpM